MVRIDMVLFKVTLSKIAGCGWCRAGGLFQDVMGAASRLHLDKEPLTALSIAFVLLAFARDRAEQAALCQGSALSVLKKLLQVQNSAWPCASSFHG